MSLVENLINQISTSGLGGISNPQNFDLEDDTFAKLLEKQMSSIENSINQTNTIGDMGVPAGLIIEPFDGIEFSNTVQDQMEMNGAKNPHDTVMVEPIEIKDIDMSDYFSNLLKAATENKSFMNFAQKHASNAYGAFKNTYITDMTEFAHDLASLIK